jgi:uncharacterized DUF497 family protein
MTEIVPCEKHGVSIAEIESLFERPVLVLPDETHSQAEERVRAIGRTDTGRYVFMVFTRRELNAEFLIRPISARYMHSKEVRHFEKDNPEFRDR